MRRLRSPKSTESGDGSEGDCPYCGQFVEIANPQAEQFLHEALEVGEGTAWHRCPACGEVFCQSMEAGTEIWYTKEGLREHREFMDDDCGRG